ncbi:MAG: hypothetical protein IPJ30_18250 [Acidobacteria bacterium]|nr:hypothetical protein [Acidobacteriota bacterium]MBK8147233.1 hypothetical protein [Acidobacteriota bacterium]
MIENPKESVRALLSEIVDYAGLFPPSQVSMPEAVLNYATYRSSNYKWMLGRFVVPVARLDEFRESAGDFISRVTYDPWRLAVLAGEDLYKTIRQIEDFNVKNSPHAVIDTLEVRASTESKIHNTVAELPDFLTAYFEIPTDGRLADLITAIAVHGQRAKIRTGGVTADDFPSIRTIIQFIRICLAANVPFKATAGLHHPLRCFRPLTYEADAPQGTMNGFLNLFLATGYAYAGYQPTILEEILEDEFEESFDFTDEGVAWHGDYYLSTAQIAHIRSKYIGSFGSCSFDEPISDLQEIGLL